MGVIARYRERLPVGADTPALSLGEGSTPLIRSRVAGERLGVELHFKFEGLNPTGSFKDRGMVVAVARALEAGASRIVCASTGNTAASAAAYAARAGIEALVLCPAGAVAPAKEAQARVAGARVLGVRGSFDDALRLCFELAERENVVHVNSVNPDRIQGQKTAVFEIADDLGRAPEVLALPYGGGGNLCAYARGFDEDGAATRMVAGEAAERATTLASAIRISEPAHAREVEAILAAGRAEVVSLPDAEIRAAWLDLAETEGIFCEPASAAGLAALAHVELEPGSTVVCVLTGHGLKDAGAVAAVATARSVVEPSVEAILAEVTG
jgi:threonine synthase